MGQEVMKDPQGFLDSQGKAEPTPTPTIDESEYLIEDL